jgi:hypothetical protein
MAGGEIPPSGFCGSAFPVRASTGLGAETESVGIRRAIHVKGGNRQETATMNFTSEELKVLSGLGFHPSRSKRKKDPMPVEERGWSQRFVEQSAWGLLHVRKTVVGFEYRVLLANPEQPGNEVQWFDAEEVRQMMRVLMQLLPVFHATRRALEGGPARRVLNRMKLMALK